MNYVSGYAWEVVAGRYVFLVVRQRLLDSGDEPLSPINDAILDYEINLGIQLT